MKKLIFLILGMIFLLTGLVGLLLPVFPQIPFLTIGCGFLMIGSKRFEKWLKGTALYQNKLSPLFRKLRKTEFAARMKQKAKHHVQNEDKGPTS